MITELKPSPSRTYVSIMYKGSGFDTLCFRKFKLPEEYDNTVSKAQWYYYNKLDLFGCGKEVIPFEMYSDLSEVKIN
jgi:hypothetical protein